MRRRVLPHFCQEAFDILEVGIPRSHNKVMLTSQGRNPNIILWNRPAHSAEFTAKRTIIPTRVLVTGEVDIPVHEFVHLSHIFRNTCRFKRSVVKLSNCNGWD